MFIFDSHAHVIPPLAGACGYESAGRHLEVCQAAMRDHLSQPPRLVEDNSIIHEKKLWDPEDLSAEGRLQVDFRVGEYGRFTWVQDGKECYIQYLPPYSADMSFSPGMLKSMMDYAGVGKAVIQCGGVYGRLNRYYADVMRENPGLKGVLYPLASAEPLSGPRRSRRRTRAGREGRRSCRRMDISGRRALLIRAQDVLGPRCRSRGSGLSRVFPGYRLVPADHGDVRLDR